MEKFVDTVFNLYNTIPIVRKTGGLADTIIDYDPRRDAGNGFVFEKFTAPEMLKAIERAITLYEDREKWRRLTLRGMDYDFSWEVSAKKYIELYNRALIEQ